MTALMMPVLIGAAGLASDTVQWTLVRRALQRQADSAALAGAYALSQSRNVTDTVTADLAKNNNFALSAAPVIENAPTVGVGAGNAAAVRVQLASVSRLPFTGLFLGSGVSIAVEATAGLVQNGEFCILALDQSAAIGITNSGNTLVDANCGMHANSSGEPAVTGQGSATIVASPVSAVGGIRDGGNFAPGTEFTPYNVYQRDPFESLPNPSVTSNGQNVRVNPNQTRNLTPGVYRDLTIQGTANLAPGTYVIDSQGGGGLRINSGAVVNGTGVTFVLTNSAFTSNSSTGTVADVSINGNATLNLRSPTSGTYQGVLFYQDRRATAMSQTVSINGTSGSTLQGAVYVPRNELRINGTAGMNVDCLQMVGFRITFSGTSDIRNICPVGSGAGAFRGAAVRLMG